MEEANYILKFNDGRLVPKNETLLFSIVQKLACAFALVLVVGSFLFHEFLLSGVSMTVWVCIIITVVYLIQNGGRIRKECYTELQFYNDFLIQYVPKHYISKKKSREEYYKIFYKDIKECNYRKVTKKVVILGKIEGIFYKYKKNGEVETEPSYHKITDTITKFYTIFEPDIDFVREIEIHSPIKVNIQNT